MVCETKTKRGQSLRQRADEVKKVVELTSAAIAAGRVRVVVGPQGAVAFSGLTEAERDGVTDGCIYRRLMVSGSSLARAAVARAEQIAGRGVNQQAVAAGWHTHDGVNWSTHR